ncbi:MAG: YrdB family protein [Bacteroidales bacterium]
MSKNPVNLLLRFLLELMALIVTAMWGYSLSDSWSRILWAILFPLLFAAIWGVYAVKEDPSRSGRTVVPTPGPVRLLLELALFGVVTWMLIDLGYTLTGAIFGGVVLIHYLISLDRILWLMRTGKNQMGADRDEPEDGNTPPH